MKLLLFDIDGTLLLTQGIGRRSVEAALARRLGRTVTTEGIAFSGRTDPGILREALLQSGLTEAEADALLPDVLDTYVEALRTTITPARVRVLPGVCDLLGHLADRTDVHLGLLTGNLEPTAYLKLDAAGLAPFFAFGAFGSDHPDRMQLPAVALRRAQTILGHTYRGRNVVIIGDTEHDIRCGRGIGAYTVGVCTGRFSRADLEPHAPDLLLDDLRDGELFVGRVLQSID